MDPIAAAVLSSWSFEFEVALGLGLTTLVYLRGFHEVRVQLPARFPSWRRTSFLAGIAVLFLALTSPVDALADLLLQVHMVQHWLLMMVAPPLLLLGAPAVPLLRGLPRRWFVDGAGPFLAWPALQRAVDFVIHPVFAGTTWAVTTLVWHLPFAYQAALRSPGWHDFEHVTFLAASLLFWIPMIGPWPAREVTGGVRVLYFAGAMLFNTIFCAVFAFSDRLFYPVYAEMPAPWGIAPLVDQNAAGAFLWIANSVVMLVAMVVAILSWLEPRATVVAGVRVDSTSHRGSGRRRRRFDLLAVPGLGAAITSLRLRQAMQVALLGVAGAIVVDGWFGPQGQSAENLAGVLPWIYWRGLVVIALLVLGNVFCGVCPFTLTRGLAGRLLGHRFTWPDRLRGPWVAVAGFALFLWAYEVFALWDSAYWTAWIVVGYFVACFVIEGLFPKGTFCRSVCPIGQFQFVASAASPFEVAAADPGVCANCRSHDCLRGNAEHPGCPTGLFLPTKLGGQDCTFCMDCVRACPHDNGVLLAIAQAPTTKDAGSPGRQRASARSLEPAVTAMVLLFSFAAFVNAAAMVAPVGAVERSFSAWLAASTRLPALSIGFAVALVVVPIAAAWGCAAAGRGLAGIDDGLRRIAAHLAPSLIPIGFAMWLVHFGFHLLTGLGSLSPVVARVLRDLGFGASGPPAVSPTLPWLSPDTLLGFEIAVLGVGLILSVATAWRVSLALVNSPRRALLLATPWGVVAGLLYGAGVWVLQQPMEMRGMLV